jgi:hypothetical protein
MNYQSVALVTTTDDIIPFVLLGASAIGTYLLYKQWQKVSYGAVVYRNLLCGQNTKYSLTDAASTEVQNYIAANCNNGACKKNGPNWVNFVNYVLQVRESYCSRLNNAGCKFAGGKGGNAYASWCSRTCTGNDDRFDDTCDQLLYKLKQEGVNLSTQMQNDIMAQCITCGEQPLYANQNNINTWVQRPCGSKTQWQTTCGAPQVTGWPSMGVGCACAVLQQTPNPGAQSTGGLTYAQYIENPNGPIKINLDNNVMDMCILPTAVPKSPSNCVPPTSKSVNCQGGPAPPNPPTTQYVSPPLSCWGGCPS